MPARYKPLERYVQDYGTERFDFSDTSWTVTFGSHTNQDTTHFLAGTSSLKVNKPAGTASVEVKKTGLALDWTTNGNLPTSITLWCYGEGELDEMNIHFACKTAGNADVVNYQYDGSYLLPVGWFAMRIPISEMAVIAGSNDNVWSAINQIVITLQSLSGTDGDYTLWIDSIYTDVKCRPAITIVFDDTYLSDYQDPAIDTGHGTKGAFDLMYNYHGMVGSSASPTDTFDTFPGIRNTTANAQIMYDAGWEFSNQNTDDTNLTTQSSETYVNNSLAATAFYQEKGWLGGEYIACYSGCAIDYSTAAAMESAGYIMGRRCESEKTVTGDATAIEGHPNAPTQAGNNKFTYVGTIYSTTATPPSTVQQAKDYIDMLIKTGSYGCIVFHRITAAASLGVNQNDADFGSIIDHLAMRRSSGAIDVVTFQQHLRGLK